MVSPGAQTDPTVDHRDIIARLSAAERRALLLRSDAKGLRQLALHLGLIAAAGALIALRVPYWGLLVPVQGVLIVFLFTALHETIHNTAFRSAWLNRAVAALCGFLILLPPRWFRAFHFAHHRHTQDPAHDPELAHSKPRTLGAYLWYLTGLPVWVDHLRALAVNAAGRNNDAFVTAAARPGIAAEARLYIALYAALLGMSVLLGSALLLWVWILPMVAGQPALRAYLLAEHTGCPHVPSMLANTRTMFTLAPVRFVAWNMPYHAEHHALPAVPFHALPKFHVHTRAHLAVTERGYLRFHRRLAASLAR